MIDFMLSSRRGFVAPRLAEELIRRGFGVAFLEDGNTARDVALFLNVSNNHSSPWENMLLVQKRLAQAEGCQVFVQFQSFSTLIGVRVGRKDGFNCGFFPLKMDRYSAGKIMAEKTLEKNRKKLGISCAYLYCSAIIDPGGNWYRVIRRVAQWGYFSPCMRQSKSFNHITISEIASVLASIREENLGPQPRRIVCNSTKSKHKTFDSLADEIAGSSRIIRYSESGYDCAKECLRAMKLMIYAQVVRFRYALGLYALPVESPQTPALEENDNRKTSGQHPIALEMEPERFSGLSRDALTRSYLMPSNKISV